jgi:hypothetical protein
VGVWLENRHHQRHRGITFSFQVLVKRDELTLEGIKQPPGRLRRLVLNKFVFLSFKRDRPSILWDG